MATSQVRGYSRPVPPPTPITALRHPLPWLAAVLIVGNDFVLRGVAPGWLTGKLADVGWLVVVPVLAAAALSGLGVGARRAERAALVATAVFYTALQLWPPLGAWFSASHVADLGDLLALPALLLAVVAWRTPRLALPVPAAPALPAFTAVLLADTPAEPMDASWPCEATPTWPTAAPLRFELDAIYDIYGDRFHRGVHLVDEDGVEVPLVISADAWPDALCARDGLEPNTSYTLTIGPWSEGSANDTPIDHPGLPAVTFTTDDSPGEPAADADACAALAEDFPLPEEDEELCAEPEEAA